MRNQLCGALAIFFSASVAVPASAETTCYGEGASTVTQSADGSMSVRTSDSSGNTYSLDSDVDTGQNGDMSVRTYDSEGNSYNLKSWSDSTGYHTEDFEGNRCTITHSGQSIGC
jgi:hypothetical protein